MLQGVLCSEDVTGLEAEWCDREATLKASIAIATLSGIGLLFLITGALTYYYVVETRDGMKAKLKLEGVYEKENIDPDCDLVQSLRGSKSTTNKVCLNQVIHGTMLRNWVQSLEAKSLSWNQFAMRSSTESFMVVAEGINSLAEDVSQFADTPIACVLRHLCDYPGLLELLLWRGGRALQGLLDFIEAMAEFETAAREEQPASLAQQLWQPPVFPITDVVVKFQHRPVLVLYLLTANDEERVHLSHVCLPFSSADLSGAACSLCSPVPSPLCHSSLRKMLSLPRKSNSHSDSGSVWPIS